jgi:hypothetical protein
LKQVPLQLVRPAPQHTPDWQVFPAAQAVPQAPQLEVSLWRLTQAPPQHVVPAPQA